jgi:hypothetical protein
MPDQVVEPTEGQTPEGQTPQDDGRIRPWGLVLTIAVSLVVFVGIGVLFYSLTYKSPSGTEVAQSAGTARVNGKVVPHVTLRFQTYPDASGFANGVAVHPGGNSAWPAYGLTNVFQVPAHALVTVYARQYDSGGALNNPWFATIRGTVGGTAVVNGKRVTSINPNNVGHTFTVRGIPGVDPGFFLNVPLPAVGGNNQADNGQYNTVVFSFISGSAGTYAWNCEFPCGTMIAGFGGPMGEFGYMSGFIHVV